MKFNTVELKTWIRHSGKNYFLCMEIPNALKVPSNDSGFEWGWEERECTERQQCCCDDLR